MKELHSLLEKAITKQVRLEGGELQDKDYFCIGSRLSSVIKKSHNGQTLDYLEGVDEWINKVGGNRLHAILMLRQAGAGHNPLKMGEWPTRPQEVLENLKMIKELPPLTNQDFSFSNLIGISLKKLDLSGSSFKNALMMETKLININFSYCDFRYARLGISIVTDCNFENAIFKNTSLYMTEINSCNIKDTILKKGDAYTIYKKDGTHTTYK